MEAKDLEKDLEEVQSKESEDNKETLTDGTDLSVEDHEDEKVSEEQEVEEDQENDQLEEKEKISKSFFKREKKAKQDSKDAKIDELNDRLVRTIAEFDNFRKRNEKEKGQMFEIGAKSIIEKILPVIDSFERGLGTVSEEDKEDSFVQGMEKVYKQLLTCLQEAGVKQIEALGKEFDPNFHNAVMHEDDPEQEENIIIEEYQKGYIYKESVVRYSMVKVVN